MAEYVAELQTNRCWAEAGMPVKESFDLSTLAGTIEAAKAVAKCYRELTGKPLGITGEVGEVLRRGYSGLNSPTLVRLGTMRSDQTIGAFRSSLAAFFRKRSRANA